jgi:hypothetical protein
MRKIILMTLLSVSVLFIFVSGSYSDEAAGRVLAVKRDVYVLKYDTKSDAKPQMALLTEDVVETGVNSRAKLFFNDDSILSLGENSRVEVAQYLYNSETERSKAVYSLVEGSLRVIVGRSDLEIHTPTAVVAARGTMFLVWLDNGTNAVVFDGDITMSDLVSELSQIDIGRGEVGNMSGAGGNVRPATSAELAQFQDVTQVIGEIMENQNEIPDDTIGETFEQFIGGGDDDDDDSGPPPEILDPPGPDAPSEAFTDVEIKIEFPPDIQ